MESNEGELKNPFIIPGIRNLHIESQLNPNYSFDNFLEGDSNRLARSAGIAVSNKPGGTSFNPLMILHNENKNTDELINTLKKLFNENLLFELQRINDSEIDSFENNKFALNA